MPSRPAPKEAHPAIELASEAYSAVTLIGLIVLFAGIVGTLLGIS